MANIKRLLNKKGWTGRELGQIELTSLAVDYKNALEGNSDAPHIVDPEELQRMIDSITDSEQGRTYNGYLSIHEWLSIKVNIANAQYQSAQLSLNKLNNYILGAMDAENIYQYVEQLPAIMTKKQYEAIRTERIEAYFKDEESGEELQSNIFNLIDSCISYYLRKLQKYPNKPNPIKAIRKKYIAQPVNSKIISSRWNEILGNGYYTIEDGSGRRSDQISLEEWQSFIDSPLMRKALDTMGTEDGKCRSRIAYNLIMERQRVGYTGEIDLPCKWHTYTEPPTGLTKWDIIKQELLLEFYPADIDGSGDKYSDSNFTASMEDFYREFKELVDFALQDMDKKYFSGGDLQAAKLPLEQWGTTFISWRRLYELDFYGEREQAEADTQIFDGNKQALFNGIAILRPSDLLSKSLRIDENGYYIEPLIRQPYFSLEDFFTEDEHYATNLGIVEDARSQLLRTYYYLLGYNTQVDLVAAYFDVPELVIFKLDLPYLAERINSLDRLVPLLYKQIKETDYRDKELQARKMEVLKDIFPPLDIERFSIPEKNIEAAKELFRGFIAFRAKREYFDSLMCFKPQTDGEDGEGA